MSEDQLDHDVLSRVGIDRRSFIKKVVIGTAFAVPVVASFDMLTSSLASGQTCAVPNTTTSGSGSGGSGTQGGAGGTRLKTGKNVQQAPCGGDPNGGGGGVVASDRRAKAHIVPVIWN